MSIRTYIPQNLSLDLMDKYNLKFFVHLIPTYSNDLIWASMHFGRVFGVTYTAHSYANLHRRTKQMYNVQLLPNDEGCIPKLLHRLRGLALFWIDPVTKTSFITGTKASLILQSLDYLRDDGRNHVLMIDDFAQVGPVSELVSALSYKDRQVKIIGNLLISEKCPQSLS